MSADVPSHLAYAGQDRENSAVDTLLSLGRVVQQDWFRSLGFDPDRHWCLIRPILKGVHVDYPELEIDFILGNLGRECWPPSLETVVAVEAKCWVKKWNDLHPRSKGPHAKTNLWEQVLRNIECGFDRAAGVDIVSTEPCPDYRDAMVASHVLGRSEAQWLSKQAEKRRLHKEAGYALFSFGAVSWKGESESGTLCMLECRDAPLLDKHSTRVENAVAAILGLCSQPGFRPPYHFVFRDARWQTVPVACHGLPFPPRVGRDALPE